jgi:gluconokinase
MQVKEKSIESPLILTLDIGTSSTRARLYDSRAVAVEGCLAQLPNRLYTTLDGGAEFKAGELLASVIGVIDQLLELAGPLADQIGGVALDTLVTNIMGVDTTGRPTSPVFTYADTRNAASAQHLRAEFGEDDLVQIHNRTGCLVHSAYLPARFHWLAQIRPDLLEAATHWVSIGEYLFEQFFGQWRVSYSVASWTGLLNRHELVWDQDWLSYLPVDESQLSPLGDVDQPLVGLQGEWAARWPVLKEVPWFPAIGDGAAANVGSGCGDPTQVALTIGTTGAMRVVLPHNVATVPAGLWLYRVDKRRALLGGATTEGGNLFAWLKKTLQLPASGELEQVLAGMSPAAHGLTVLPFIAGERAPGWHGDARASLIGFTLNTDPLDIVRAGLESVAYRFALIYRLIKPHLPVESNHQIIASGGGLLSSPAWLQIMADVLGRSLLTLAEKEATSRGIALLALESLGLIEEITDLPPATGKIYEPNNDHYAQYKRAIEKQIELYQELFERKTGE